MFSKFLKPSLPQNQTTFTQTLPNFWSESETALQTMVCKTYTTKLSLASETESLTNGPPSNYAGWQAV